MSEGIPDVEIGRYAVRTFGVALFGRWSGLWSLSRGYRWEGGVGIAECRIVKSASGIYFRPGNDYTTCGTSLSSIPGENCSCGLYGALSLKSLFSQYSHQASNNIAVIAAEGPTIIGPKGLRTAAARVVGYWCFESPERDIYARECPEAQSCATINELAEAFGFDPPGRFRATLPLFLRADRKG